MTKGLSDLPRLLGGGVVVESIALAFFFMITLVGILGEFEFGENDFGEIDIKFMVLEIFGFICKGELMPGGTCVDGLFLGAGAGTLVGGGGFLFKIDGSDNC